MLCVSKQRRADPAPVKVAVHRHAVHFRGMFKVPLDRDESRVGICGMFGHPRNERRHATACFDIRARGFFNAEPLWNRSQNRLDPPRPVSVAQFDSHVLHVSPPIELLRRLRVALISFVIRQPRIRILLGRHLQVRRLAPNMLRVQMPEKRHAPAAARASTQAFTDERRHRRILNRQKRSDLPQTHAKAQTNFIIRVHRQSYEGCLGSGAVRLDRSRQHHCHAPRGQNEATVHGVQAGRRPRERDWLR